ncbi:MAG: 2OG-Fe(II) oxygenase [Gammaproteobacteria bacterium]|nr:2OG-Fe(II) oxygenase [Gammaproteobacteria bacterium]
MTKITKYNEGVIAIANFLTISECRKIIFDSNKLGFEQATVNSGNSQELDQSVRNNNRVHFYNSSLSNKLYRRIYQFLPKQLNGWIPIGLNERFRFYQYNAGEYFKWHQDDTYVKGPGVESRYTFLIYLNDDYEGGGTEFESFTVTPVTGTAVLFPNNLNHQGSEIDFGTKYAIRTDIMYQE